MPEKPHYKKALVFGVFDGLHEGHRHFLSQALTLCDELIVVVAQSETVQTLKGHAPKYSYKERRSAITAFKDTLTIVPGDFVLGSWSAIHTHKPDVVFLGYDQYSIAEELKKMAIPMVFLESHYPETYKSSLLHKNT